MSHPCFTGGSNILFKSLKNILHKLPKSLDRGDIEAFAGGMDLSEVGSHRNAIKSGDLLREDSAFKTAVSSRYDAFLARSLTVSVHNNAAKLAVALVLPRRIVTVEINCRIRERDCKKVLDLINEIVLLGCYRGTDGL